MSQIKTRSIFFYRQRVGSWYEILTHNKKFHFEFTSYTNTKLLWKLYAIHNIYFEHNNHCKRNKILIDVLIIVFRNQGGLVYQCVMLPKILSHNGCGLWNMLYTHIWKLYLFTVTNSLNVLYVFINILITKCWDSKMMSQGVVM